MAYSPSLQRSLNMMGSVDKETGCYNSPTDQAAYQLCRQAYYQKNQPAVVQPVVQTSVSSNQDNSVQLRAEVDALRQQIQTMQMQQATSVPPQQTPVLDNAVVPYSLLGILVIGIAVLMKMKIITLT